MKIFMGLVMLALVSIAASDDTAEERKRIRAEKLATISGHMTGHLRKGDDHHSRKKAPSSVMRQARKDERGGLKAKDPSANDANAKQIRRVADQLSEHRKYMERPAPRNLPHVREAQQHSLADMRAPKGSRQPAVANAKTANNVKKKDSLDKLAKHMAHRVGAAAVREAAVKGDPRKYTMKAAHEAQVVGRTSTHAAVPMREKMESYRSNLKGMQHRLAKNAPHRKDAEGEKYDAAEDGEE